MSNQLFMMLHATFGVLAMLCGLWLFVETLNAAASNRRRIVAASLLLALFMWVTYVVGGSWYVDYYGAEKALIKAGPFPSAHGFFMETKEHVFLLLLLLATWLPIAVWRSPPATGGPARSLILWSSGLMVLGTLAMEGAGALVSLGVKMSLLPH